MDDLIAMPVPDAGVISMPVLKWAVEQGALVLLLLVVAYFYRKDFQSKIDNATDKIQLLTEVIAQQNMFTTQLIERVSRLTEQSVAVHAQVTTVLMDQAASAKALLHELVESGSIARGSRKDSRDS